MVWFCLKMIDDGHVFERMNNVNKGKISNSALNQNLLILTDDSKFRKLILKINESVSWSFVLQAF
jgi:predicted nuclease of predicted toxin-antitoxin system